MNGNGKLPRITIPVEYELRDKLNAEALRTGKSAAQIARDAIASYLNRSLMSEATKIQQPLEEKVNMLVDENNYLKNMIEGVYRSVAYMVELSSAPSEVKQAGGLAVVVKGDTVKTTARKKSMNNFRKMKQSSLSIGEYLEDYLVDGDAFEEEEEPVHQSSPEELQAQRDYLYKQLQEANMRKQFEAEQPKEETPQDNQQQNQQPKPQSRSAADKIASSLFGGF